MCSNIFEKIDLHAFYNELAPWPIKSNKCGKLNRNEVPQSWALTLVRIVLFEVHHALSCCLFLYDRRTGATKKAEKQIDVNMWISAFAFLHPLFLCSGQVKVKQPEIIINTDYVLGTGFSIEIRILSILQYDRQKILNELALQLLGFEREK